MGDVADSIHKTADAVDELERVFGDALLRLGMGAAHIDMIEEHLSAVKARVTALENAHCARARARAGAR